MSFQYKADEPMPPVRNAEEGGLRDAAMTWVSMDFPIITVRGGDKAAHPAPLGGPGYKLSDAGIIDPQRVYDIWSTAPGLNIGVVCGAPSRLLVLDGDCGKPNANPMGALAKWQEQTGIEIPQGPIVETASGGFHLYLRLPDGVGHVHSPSGWLPNVDIRCDGSYVVAPPSFRLTEVTEANPDGAALYSFLDLGGSPYSPTPNEFLAELEEAVAPLELIEDIRTHGSARTRSKGPGAAARAGNRRSNGLAGVAWYMEHGIPDDAIQWDVLYNEIAWPMLNKGYDRAVTVTTMRAVLDKTTLSRPWEPWRDGRPEDDTRGQTLWGITNRAYNRAETMDGDELYEAKKQKHLEERYGDLITWLLPSTNNNLNEKGTAK